jgi:hypothetical protein
MKLCCMEATVELAKLHLFNRQQADLHGGSVPG